MKFDLEIDIQQLSRRGELDLSGFMDLHWCCCDEGNREHFAELWE